MYTIFVKLMCRHSKRNPTFINIFLKEKKNTMKIQMPENVKYILEKLNNAGYEAYAVGGCVRDSVLNREPDDWDITTSAKPEEVKAVFSKTIDTGIQHGTVTVLLGREGYEVTTYRIDGEYEDSRHPKEVTFTPDLLEDLKRRDFTINAMTYNHLKEGKELAELEEASQKSGLVDAFGGIEDIQNKIIRCVGNPLHRFEEDALRMMRAVRFSAQLGYEIEQETQNAICKLCGNLSKISVERIQAELVKLLVSDNPMYLKKAYELGMTKIFLPEFDAAMETEQNNPHHKYSVGEHILHSMEYVEKDKILRLAMLLHDIGKPSVIKKDEEGIDHFYGHCDVGADMARTILRRLRFDNDTIEKVCKLVKCHDWQFSEKTGNFRKQIVKIGTDIFPLLLKVKEADVMSQSAYKREEKLQKIKDARRMYETILEEKDCLRLKDMAINGRDLINAGMKPGKEIGEVLQKIFEYVLENPEKNNKEILLDYYKKITEIS